MSRGAEGHPIALVTRSGCFEGFAATIQPAPGIGFTLKVDGAAAIAAAVQRPDHTGLLVGVRAHPQDAHAHIGAVIDRLAHVVVVAALEFPPPFRFTEPGTPSSSPSVLALKGNQPRI